MNLFTIPPGAPFLDTLAAWWLAREADPLRQSEGLMLLPTRRAARALTEAFLRAAEGRPLLLPRIAAIGALDEAPLALDGALDLPDAVPQPERLAALTRLVMGLDGQYGAPVTADRAWLLAAELARLLDEAHREGVVLGEALPRLVPDAYAAHWGDTLHFLQIVTTAWPGWLEANGRIDPADRAVRLLRAQAAAWEAAPPQHPVVVAGTSGGILAMAELMRVAARLPQGRVVLPGLDLGMDDALWEALDDGHPQAGLRALLAQMGATRGDVQPWPGAVGHARVPALWTSLLPAKGLHRWRGGAAPVVAGLERLEPIDQQEEAAAVAMVLREALEQPGAQAALVTPDRVLAARVAAELARFGVVVDDSAGEKLGDTPPGAFLRLLAQAVADGLSPVALLGVLKHPFAALGLRRAECRRLARRLELACLRGPAPPPGVAGLRARLADSDDVGLVGLVDRIEACLAPLLDLAGDVAPAEALRALVEAAEAVAATDRQAGAVRLWALEEGDALATHLAALLDACRHLPPQPVRVLPGLLDASLAGEAVRSRRALRGRDGAEHPRVAILGLLEARLQSFDVLVLGSLAEAVWPPASDPGPWMSRPMRRAAGLASPEAALGQMAHDYAMLACAAPKVVLSCPARRDGAPAVPARWLVRLEAFLKGHGTALARNPAAHWARQLDQPAGPPRPVRPPAPRPPVAARPRTLSVTEVETWLRDPYAIHARRVLRLRALDGLEESVENADFGSLVHGAIAAWLPGLGTPVPPGAAAGLRGEMDRLLLDPKLRPALVTWWRPRLHRIADWVAEEEARRRRESPNQVARTEVDGRWAVPGADFVLRGRADRIERRPDGRLAILDYKTGAPPRAADVLAGRAPQLPLEAAMAAAGAFGPELAGEVAELTYWHLTGSYEPGAAHPALGKDAAVAEVVARAAAGLVEVIARYDDPAQAYLSQPHPGAAPRFTDYAQLARVAEWSAAEEEG